MEDNVQRIFSILLAVLMFFLLPLYIAFEKRDDISYNLALQITTNFVNSVTEKGYLTYDMYNDFITELTTTGNVYDIKLEYIAKQYNPVIQVTNNEDKTIHEYEYYTMKAPYEEHLNSEENTEIFKRAFPTVSNTDNLEARLTYKLSEYKYSLSSPNAT